MKLLNWGKTEFVRVSDMGSLTGATKRLDYQDISNDSKSTSILK